ncbi:hypothetical protein ANO14919_028350 [Xylariales sp. No.14919]|nr:hypothetical protein ANO14919_028350 [Xylariales sp. No.14919]
MAQSTDTLRRTLSFYSPPLDGSDPEYIEGTSEESGRRNYPNREESVLIRDMRGHHKSFTLDEHSFTVLPGVFDLNIDFTEPMEITERYLPWVDDLLRRNIPRVASVTTFNYTMRKASTSKTPIRQVHKIHIDQSPKGAFMRARRHLPAEDITAIENGKAHFRIINVWKPVFRPVKDYPITAAEFRSLRATDLVPVRQVSSDYVGETYVAKYRDGQRFWYWSDMTPDDVFLIQCFDSEEQSPESVALGGLQHAQCAHGSFRLADDMDESCTRESIEVRCLVVIV